jgi:putative transcriptional regulator
MSSVLDIMTRTLYTRLVGSMVNHLRELRASRGWSQGDLAEALNVSRQTVNAIETGKYDPSLPLAFKIARLFKRPIEEIFKDR